MFASWRRLLPGRTVVIPPELWHWQIRALPLLQRWDAGEREQLRALCARFLAQKRMVGAAGLTLTARMQLHIATQACLPILHLGLHWYRGWTGVVVYPAAFRVRREEHDDIGLVHSIDAELTGEAWLGGPVVLSWEDAAQAQESTPSAAAGMDGNVVIHEFAHKLDLLDGDADGIPPFDGRVHRGLDRALWRSTLEDAFERFSAELDIVESELPRDVDPESTGADRFFARLPLDPYAATDTAEFFAVSSEAYFLRPGDLRNAFPDWFGLLHRFYLGSGAARD